MSGKQKMTWDGDAHTKLLLAFLKVSEAKIDFDAVAEELSTDAISCTARAIQEQLKKLRKIAQPDGSTAPAKSTPTDTPSKAKATRKAPATPAGGVKKTRKPATGGKGKKGKAAATVEAESAPVKVETGSDDAMDASSVVGEGSANGSDQAQAGLDDETFA